MNKPRDDEWIENILARHELPGPSRALRKNILKSAQNSSRMRTAANEKPPGLLISRWEARLAMGIALFLGIFAGFFTTPSPPPQQKNIPAIYMNADFIFAQAILGYKDDLYE